ncbi:MAG: phytanoyl-CoA dioxygenase family protein [Microbacterium sp.]|uniref:phytanoyl-CoA dioxygenase family protein n=1 Tax=Microbacterium sp. TaxID=51671 RepID=UPI0039E43FB5
MDAVATRAFESLCSDGVAFHPALLDEARCRQLLDAVGWARDHPTASYRCLSPSGEARLESDLFRWRDVPAIRDLVTDEALLQFARAYLGTDDPVVLEDQWFWSERGSRTDSPWHQDDPYHPLDRPFLTIWIPLTPVPPGLGLRGVVGSHDGPIYAPVEFSAGERTLTGSAWATTPVPDVDAHPDEYVVTDSARDAGDAVLLDSRTLHSAGGECASDFVRLSIRYAHPETTRSPRPWPTASFWESYEWETGERLPATGFPRSSVLAATAAAR